MKKVIVAALAGLFSVSAFAAQGDILARFRVVNVAPDVSIDKTLTTLGTSVKQDIIPEVDFTYMITNNIGAELILGTSRHEVQTNALGSLGKVSVLPPTLTLQYHFSPEKDFRPYVGVGVNYTLFYRNDLKALGGNVDVKNSSWGLAYQAGFDYALNKDWFLNVDVKKIDLKTDVTSAVAGPLGTLKINPWVYGIGIGTKF